MALLLAACGEPAAPSATDRLGQAALLTGWSCSGDASPAGACAWDCTGEGLLLTTPGMWTVDLTAPCTLRMRAWGAGGGGGSFVIPGENPGGGGGGGSGVLTADDTYLGQLWVVGGGGGGAASGDPRSETQPGAGGGGGGGGGGFGEVVADLPAGARLTLFVGGGGQGVCNGLDGDGGAPDGGTQDFNHRMSYFGGGLGGSLSGDSIAGGGGGAGGASTWGGGGGIGDGMDYCPPNSKHGLPGGCKGPLEEGGGGGGGGGLGSQVVLGETGRPGQDGGAGGRGGGPADATPSVPSGQPGRGGDADPACAASGEDGRLELWVETPGTGLECPSDRVKACDGSCAPADHVGDGVCDVRLDCADRSFDGGDCPESGLPIPDWIVDRCPAETAQSAFCLTSLQKYTPSMPLEQYFLLVGLDDGSACQLVDWPWQIEQQTEIDDKGTMAWQPPYRIVTTMDPDPSGVMIATQIDLGDAHTADLPWIPMWWYFDHGDIFYYDASPGYAGGIVGLTGRDPPMRWFHRFDEIALGGWEVIGTDYLPNMGPQIAGTGRDQLYRKTHDRQDREVQVFDLGTGSQLPSVMLAQKPRRDSRGSHYGLDVLNDTIWLVGNYEQPDWNKPMIESFSAVTGRQDRFFPLPTYGAHHAMAYGLACYPQ